MKKTIDYLLLSAMSVTPVTLHAQAGTSAEKLPNVIFILGDDLGIGDVGCYGQQRIKTPAIDKLAAEGMMFTQFYSGSTVSAPSRCALMTGKHTGHCYIRGNKGQKSSDGDAYDYALGKDEVTVGEIFKSKNYATACVGKWGLGGSDSQGAPNRQGFDYFYGYLGQGQAHRYYPMFLFENDQKVVLDKKSYSHDLIIEKALNFIEKNAEKPFFLYLAPTIPHADIIVPEGERGEYENAFYETPFINKNKQGKGYTSQPKPNATYAAMVTRLDRDIQRVMDLLEKKGISDNTVVIFSSDNGTHKEGGHDPNFFDSNGPFRGIKRDLYDGGIRAPFVVRWPAKMAKGTFSYHVSAFWDFLPTMCDLIGAPQPKGIDGISILPELTGTGVQKQHDYLYWEFHEMGGKRAVLKNNWKLIELSVNDPKKTVTELYNLSSDPGEMANVVHQFPEKVKELKAIMYKARTDDPAWPFSQNADSE